jgi:DNA gyrase subunit A
MTDDTTTTPDVPGGRVEPVELQTEMQRSYIDYAMAVIVGRALPDVRDGLKPVHRRVLYAMYDGGYRPDRGFSKCSRVVGDVMGQYHPHGDTAIYDTLVRLSQPWVMRAPLVSGQGNFGSPGNDRAAAMRYCVTGDTLVRTWDAGTVRIADIAPDAEPGSETDIDLKVVGKDGGPVRATKFFHSGLQQTLQMTTREGYELTGSRNHPVLTLSSVAGVPTLLWKLLDEVQIGERVVMQREDPEEWGNGADEDHAAATSRSLSADHVPFVAEFLRRHGARNEPDRQWLIRHNVDRLERWERDRREILARITDEASEVVWPLVDGRFSYATVKSIDDAGVRDVYSLRIDTADHAFITNGFISHNTECKMAPLAMEMVRDIDQDTVNFRPNYDGRSEEPVLLPARFPNLLVNGSAGIAVGMATNIPPHNLREVASGVQWSLEHPDATRAELLEALLERIKGPDFPLGALIVGTAGIDQAYRTGRGSVTMRAIIDVEEDSRNRTCLVVTQLPYLVNPDNLALKIAELADSGRVQGIADVRDDSSSRTGQRLVIVLKRDAIARVVLNNLYKHTELQSNFSCNMLALVDDVPRTLTLDQFVSNWVAHQIDVIQRRTRYRLRKAEEEAHIQRALVKALDRLDDVIALIRASQTTEEARDGLMEMLDIDEVQARAILDMQLRRLAALERQKIIDELAGLERLIADLQDILADEARQRTIVSEELAAIVDKFGNERRSQIIPADGDLSMEDLVPDEDVVVTITRGGYAKRTKADLYRVQKRGGKGVRGAALKGDDVVEHFFSTSNHHWLLFFTTAGRVYRTKAYHLPETARDAKGSHVAGLLSFQPDEQIAQVLAIRDYEQAPYLVLATRRGYAKKTRLTDYNSPRQAGVIAINFRDDEDELIGAELVTADDDLLLVSRKGQSVRFRADDEQLRPMGRATSGVTGMKFRAGDELLSMSVVRAGQHDDGEEEPRYVFTVTNGGWAKRTVVGEYRVQGRGGLGIKAMKLADARGSLVGAMVVVDGDEVLAVKASGQVTRSAASDVPAKGRDTMGVKFVTVAASDSVVAIARNAERDVDDELLEDGVSGDDEGDGSPSEESSPDADPKEDVAE